MVFVDKLIERIIETKNPSMVGLDTQMDFIPGKMKPEASAGCKCPDRAAAAAIYKFNMQIIDAIKDIVPAVKPQIAFYEIYGQWGMEAFEKTALYAHENGLLVVADAKRNDIGSTAKAYSDAYLGGVSRYNIDAMTVNPYLGFDGIEPFLENCRKYDKGIFVLVKTSNPSSGQLQDLDLASGEKVYEHVADLVEEWGGGDGLVGTYGYGSVGAVVGATYPEQGRLLRKRIKRAYFLVPGFGAQGGAGIDAAACFDDSGLGAVVNASRSVLCAWSHERWGGKYTHDDFAAAARAEALRMRDEINQALKIGT